MSHTPTKTPLVSFITVTLNAQDHIRPTLESIQAQTCGDFELIVVDGKSTDKTLAICHEFRNIITQLVSEPDENIFDAMNKGLSRATGQYVWFMNAGDTLYHNRILESIARLPVSPDIVFGQTLILDPKRRPLGYAHEVFDFPHPRQIDVNCFRYGGTVFHQSFVVKREIAGPFDTHLPVRADFEWMIECYHRANNSQELGLPLSQYLIGGNSSRRRLRSLVETLIVLYRQYSLRMCSLYLWYRVKKWIVRQLPASQVKLRPIT